ncbi:cob(I)yrinic acid a,c-diamide adenosyltransferase [Thioclava sp. GXIMD4216]|uniref:cob(I)yrinic acid a,c-diamide adenosyltransferase n=1 Tax=unclassified Thioclava TaxID=2621713 RepID=UPI0030CC09AB
MVVLNKIYTRTGDGGQTALVDGQRVAKSSARVNSYGTVDELNAVLGLARLHAQGDLQDQIARIQNDLFDLGADLARPDPERDEQAGYEVLRILQSQTDRLETEIDAMTAVLEPLRSFILPGGTACAAHLHHARTVARRAEREAVALMEVEQVNPHSVKYLNRLSDWLFAAARMANDEGRSDILWVPGANR